MSVENKVLGSKVMKIEKSLTDISFYRYIVECIDSIMNQPMQGMEFEILCIDDWSKDRSYAELTRIVHKNNKVRILKNSKNEGGMFYWGAFDFRS